MTSAKSLACDSQLAHYKAEANTATSRCFKGTQFAVKTGSVNLPRICLLPLIPNTSEFLGPHATGALKDCVLKVWMNKVL